MVKQRLPYRGVALVILMSHGKMVTKEFAAIKLLRVG
jgi:hypothetical protein